MTGQAKSVRSFLVMERKVRARKGVEWKIPVDIVRESSLAKATEYLGSQVRLSARSPARGGLIPRLTDSGNERVEWSSPLRNSTTPFRTSL